MKVGVAIVAYGNAAEVAACLGAVGAQRHRDFRVVICENGDAAAFDALRNAVPEALPGGQSVTLVHASDNPGYAGGVNRAMAAAAEADGWWVLNPDTQPTPDALAALVERAAKGDVAVVGGTLVGGDGRVQTLGGRWRAKLARTESIGRGADPAASVDARAIEAMLDYQTGASMLVTRALMEAIGPMREDYFLYCEEVEWCLRARAAGLAIGFAPDARVLHHQGTTTGSAGDIRARPRLPIYLDERNKLNMVRDTRPADLITAIPAALALLLLRYGKAGAWVPMRHAVAGWWAGVRNQRGKPAWLVARRGG